VEDYVKVKRTATSAAIRRETAKRAFMLENKKAWHNSADFKLLFIIFAERRDKFSRDTAEIFVFLGALHLVALYWLKLLNTKIIFGKLFEVNWILSRFLNRFGLCVNAAVLCKNFPGGRTHLPRAEVSSAAKNAFCSWQWDQMTLPSHQIVYGKTTFLRHVFKNVIRMIRLCAVIISPVAPVLKTILITIGCKLW
jgi:hypothetical protein